MTDVVKKVVFAPRQFTQFLHTFADDFRDLQVVGIGCFPALKVNIRVLGRAPNFRSFRIDTPATKFSNSVPVDQFGHIFVIDDVYFLNFMGRPKPIKEMEKRNAAFNGYQMRYQSQVHDFLHRG